MFPHASFSFISGFILHVCRRDKWKKMYQKLKHANALHKNSKCYSQQIVTTHSAVCV